MSCERDSTMMRLYVGYLDSRPTPVLIESREWCKDGIRSGDTMVPKPPRKRHPAYFRVPGIPLTLPAACLCENGSQGTAGNQSYLCRHQWLASARAHLAYRLRGQESSQTQQAEPELRGMHTQKDQVRPWEADLFGLHETEIYMPLFPARRRHRRIAPCSRHREP